MEDLDMKHTLLYNPVVKVTLLVMTDDPHNFSDLIEEKSIFCTHKVRDKCFYG